MLFSNNAKDIEDVFTTVELSPAQPIKTEEVDEKKTRMSNEKIRLRIF